MHIEVEGVHPVEARCPCHLVEIVIKDHIGPIKLSDFTQETSGQPRMNWQVPWDERVLNAEGTEDVSGRFPRNIVADGKSVRVAFFFHLLDAARPLMTPAGDVTLPTATPRPERLAFLAYESPD